MHPVVRHCKLRNTLFVLYLTWLTLSCHPVTTKVSKVPDADGVLTTRRYICKTYS